MVEEFIHLPMETSIFPFYKMLHLLGNPQSPSLSFASGCPFAPLDFVSGAGTLALFFDPLFSTFATVSEFAPPPSDVFLIGSSSQKLTLRMALPNDSP